jgi:hypothetical protein
MNAVQNRRWVTLGMPLTSFKNKVYLKRDKNVFYEISVS